MKQEETIDKERFRKIYRKYYPTTFNYCPDDKSALGLPDYIAILDCEPHGIMLALEFKVIRDGKVKFRPLQIRKILNLSESGMLAGFFCRVIIDDEEPFYCIFTGQQMKDRIYRAPRKMIDYMVTWEEIEYWISQLPNSPIPTTKVDEFWKGMNVMPTPS